MSSDSLGNIAHTSEGLCSAEGALRGVDEWYAFRVYGGRTDSVARDAERRGYESYIPMHIVERNVFGRKLRCQRPLVASLIFVRADRDYVDEVQRNPMNGASVYRLPGSDEPTPIPDSEMSLFRRVTEIGADNLEIVDEGLAIGERVRVTDGVFKGCEGCMARVRGAKRLIVAIEGVAAVATSYIPKEFLEKI